MGEHVQDRLPTSAQDRGDPPPDLARCPQRRRWWPANAAGRVRFAVGVPAALRRFPRDRSVDRSLTFGGPVGRPPQHGLVVP
jgi:hypothetical protein